MDAMRTLSQHAEFFSSAYSVGHMMTAFLLLAVVDLALKGWGMWRAARMQKKWWFIALLVVNSLGIFPAVFLLTTNSQYKEYVKKK
jgi:hypothetical protein